MGIRALLLGCGAGRIRRDRGWCLRFAVGGARWRPPLLPLGRSGGLGDLVRSPVPAVRGGLPSLVEPRLRKVATRPHVGRCSHGWWRGWGFGGRIPGGEGAGEIKKNSGLSMDGPRHVHLWSRTTLLTQSWKLLLAARRSWLFGLSRLGDSNPRSIGPYGRKQRSSRQTHR